MELLTFTIAAGETKRFERAGRYLEIIDAAGPIDVHFSDADGGRSDNARGALSGLFMEGAFTAFEVFSATAQVVSLLLTDGRGGSRRAPGVVQVVDGGKARTLASQAYIGYLAATAAAGQVPVVQLLNGAANTTRVIVRSIRLSCTAVSTVSLGSYSPALPTGPVGTSNKLIGGAFSNARMYRDTPAVSPATLIEAQSIQANVLTPWTMEEPFVLLPGQGLCAYSSSLASTLLAAFEFVEEPLTSS